MATKDNKIDAFKKAEMFLTDGWNPTEYTQDAYLTICSDLKEILKKLKAAERNNLSDEEFEKERIIAQKAIESLLQ